MIIVSACLAGVRCRYDGEACPVEHIVKLIDSGDALAVCPEILGGLPVPRSPAEIVEGEGEDVLSGKARVIAHDAVDVTEHFLRGAQEVLAIARRQKVQEAIFKQGSPSCGCGEISRNGRRKSGDGVTTAMLRREGVVVRGEEGKGGKDQGGKVGGKRRTTPHCTAPVTAGGGIAPKAPRRNGEEGLGL